MALKNPGVLFSSTRHNVGAMFLDHYSKKKGLKFKSEKFGKASLSPNCLFLDSKTFMNLSSNNIKLLSKTYNTNDISAKLLVICDNLEGTIGSAKIKVGGSAK